MNKILKFIIFLLSLPFILVRDLFTSQHSFGKKLWYFLLILLIFFSLWFKAFTEIKYFIIQEAYDLGITDRLTKVQVRGTSMLPTILDGSTVELNSPKKFGLEIGDIVSFTNLETGGLHYIKRIIAQEEEEVAIKNGLVFIGNKALDESYTLNKLPTYGNTFLSDCEKVTVPENEFLVLGDNRTVSSDSRVLGFINKNDIDGVIKAHTTREFLTKQKQKEVLQTSLNPDTFLKFLNEKRPKIPLATHATLNELAQKHAEQIRDKFETWKTQTISVDKLLEENGYRNNLVHEFVTFGYLDEKAVLDQILESTVEKDAFLSDKFLEVGIGVAEKQKDECRFPIISVIITWPEKPTYDQKVIDSWRQESDAATKMVAELQKLTGSPRVNQTTLKEAITKSAEAAQIASRIYNKMKNKDWLTQKDEQDITNYPAKIKELETLLKSLSPNSKLTPSPLPVL